MIRTRLLRMDHRNVEQLMADEAHARRLAHPGSQTPSGDELARRALDDMLTHYILPTDAPARFLIEIEVLP